MNEIKSMFLSGELNYLDAILELETRGFSSLEAEALVSGWEEEASQ